LNIESFDIQPSLTSDLNCIMFTGGQCRDCKGKGIFAVIPIDKYILNGVQQNKYFACRKCRGLGVYEKKKPKFISDSPNIRALSTINKKPLSVQYPYSQQPYPQQQFQQQPYQQQPYQSQKLYPLPQPYPQQPYPQQQYPQQQYPQQPYPLPKSYPQPQFSPLYPQPDQGISKNYGRGRGRGRARGTKISVDAD
jgi:hypothetical protein